MLGHGDLPGDVDPLAEHPYATLKNGYCSFVAICDKRGPGVG